MPYISITIGQKIRALQRQKLKTELGSLITLLPGKTEPDLIVNIQDGGSVYMGGAEVPCVYIDLKIHRKIPIEAKRNFTEAIFQLFADDFGIPVEHQYLTITEHNNWGYDGKWH